MTVGALFRDAWRFARGDWRTVLIWSLLSLVLAVVMRWGMAPFYQAQAEAIVIRAQGLRPPFPPIGRLAAVWLVMTIYFLALYNAVFRAILFPERRGFAYLRLGMDELRLLGLVLILFVALIVAEMLAILGLVLVGLLGSVVLGKTAAGAIVAVIALAILAGAVFVVVRLVVVAPLTLYRGRIMIGPAWRLTRGRFWTLFATGLIMMIVLALITLVTTLPTMGAMAAAMSRPADQAAQFEFARLQAEQMSRMLTPAGFVQMAIGAIMGGPVLAIYAGIPAVAVRQLLAETEGSPHSFDIQDGPWNDNGREAPRISS